MSNARTINVEQFQHSLFFSLTIRRPGVRVQVRDMGALEAYLGQLHATGEEATDVAVDVPKSMSAGNGTVKITKRILLGLKPTKADKCPDPYDKAVKFLNEVKKSVCGPFGKALPSRITEGLFVVRKDLAEEIDTMLKEAKDKLSLEYMPAVESGYEDAKLRAKDTPVKQGGLGPLWRAADYTSPEVFASQFDIEWQWLALGVPDDLPLKLRAEAEEKLHKQFTEASEEIRNALRVSFAELIAHATSKLEVKPGEKAPQFKDSLIGNILQFCEVFESRNMMNDEELKALVAQAKEVTTGMKPDDLRKKMDYREQAKAAFAAIQEKLDGMIVVKPTRQFDLSTED